MQCLPVSSLSFSQKAGTELSRSKRKTTSMTKAARSHRAAGYFISSCDEFAREEKWKDCLCAQISSRAAKSRQNFEGQDLMFSHWHHGYFPLPVSLSLLEWSVFSLYWSAAAKNASPAVWSESSKSRRVHAILVNIALLLVVLPIRELSPRFLPRAQWIAWLGVGIQTASLALAIWARRHLASHWSGKITIKAGHELIRSGPYRLIRHPIYSAILGMFIGSAIVSGQVLALFGLIMAASAYRRKIRLEEANLKRAFGHAYDVYRCETGALIPRRWFRGSSAQQK